MWSPSCPTEIWPPGRSQDMEMLDPHDEEYEEKLRVRRFGGKVHPDPQFTQTLQLAFIGVLGSHFVVSSWKAK